MSDLTHRIAVAHHAVGERSEVYGCVIVCACRYRFLGKPNEGQGWPAEIVARRMHAAHVAEVTEQAAREQVAEAARVWPGDINGFADILQVSAARRFRP